MDWKHGKLIEKINRELSYLKILVNSHGIDWEPEYLGEDNVNKIAARNEEALNQLRGMKGIKVED